MAKKSAVQKVAEKQNKKAVKKPAAKPRAPRELRSFIVVGEDGRQYHIKNYCLKQGYKYLTVMSRLRKRDGEALILQHDDPCFSPSEKGALRKVIVVLNGKVFQMSPTVAYALEGAIFINKKKWSTDGKTWFEIEFSNKVTEDAPVETEAPSEDDADEETEDEESDEDDEDEDEDDEDEDVEV